MVKVSIIIPAYKAGTGLLRTLDSLYSMEYEEPYEVIVVNSSQDGLEEKVRNRFPQTRFIQLENRAYTAEAKNIGIRQAEGRLFAFIDADCVAAPDWLSKIVAKYLDGYKVVGGAVCNVNPESLTSRAEYLLESIQLAPQSPVRFVKLISTANCFIAREVFEKHGYFPDIKKSVDLVFSQQISIAGEKLLFDPSIRIYHQYSETMGRFLKKQIVHGRSFYVSRKRITLPGGFLVNMPFMLPLSPIIRLVIVAKHVIHLRTGLFKDYFATFPIFLSGVMAWSYGILFSAVKRESQG